MNTQNQIDQLYALLDAYAKVSHLVDCGELVWNTNKVIAELEDEDFEDED
jgi:hypothetical protein